MFINFIYCEFGNASQFGKDQTNYSINTFGKI